MKRSVGFVVVSSFIVGLAMGCSTAPSEPANNPAPPPPPASAAAPAASADAAKLKPCGGEAGLTCPSGFVCVDDPTDKCDPARGAKDCEGFCRPNTSIPPVPAPSVTAAAPPPSHCPQGMAYVPGGSYAWGAKKENVQVGSFCLDLSETTAGEYAACVKGGKCTEDFLKCAPQATYFDAEKKNYPIVCVDLKQATSYCAAQNKRLPSEEEWEWAARGGSEARTFPWGNDAPKDQLCWAGAGKQTGPCEVGSHPKGDSAQGIHDLAGNVFEWTTSRNDATSPVRDGRGGSWKDGVAEAFKVTRPGAFAPSYRCGFLGIRCATPADAK